jgi:hypothetical protein
MQPAEFQQVQYVATASGLPGKMIGLFSTADDGGELRWVTKDGTEQLSAVFLVGRVEDSSSQSLILNYRGQSRRFALGRIAQPLREGGCVALAYDPQENKLISVDSLADVSVRYSTMSFRAGTSEPCKIGN